MPAHPLIVVMGVSGSGKSTVGALLADALQVPFTDADDLHPRSNVEKMAVGAPLTDDDRWPWLRLVGRALAEASATGLVVACSALKRSYREAILAEAADTTFVLLSGSRDLLASRIGARKDHFMPASLLDSQLATLEPLGQDEPGVTIDISADPAELTSAIVQALAGR
jgi:carbohydrate kinase (thermoresistant glucokinase family)